MVIPCWGKGWERKEMKAHQLLMVGLVAGILVSCSENSLEPDTTPPGGDHRPAGNDRRRGPDLDGAWR